MSFVRRCLFHPFFICCALAALILWCASCHHSSVSGGGAVPFEFSEEVLDGNYYGVGIWVSPDPAGPGGNNYIVTNEELVTDGLGAFTVDRITNQNGAIVSSTEAGTYSITTAGEMSFEIDGTSPQSLTGGISRWGDVAYLSAKEKGDDPGLILYVERGEPGSYSETDVDNTFDFFLYGFGYDLQQVPGGPVVGAAFTSQIRFFPGQSVYSSLNIFWAYYDFDQAQGVTTNTYIINAEPYTFDLDGNLVLENFSFPALQGETEPRRITLSGGVSPGGSTGVLSTTNADDPPLMAILIKKENNAHNASGLRGDYFAIGMTFQYTAPHNVFSFVDFDFDGVDAFSAEFTSIFEDGFLEWQMDGNYTLGPWGGLNISSPSFVPQNKVLSGASRDDDEFATTTPVNLDTPDIDPGLLIIMESFTAEE